MNDFSSHEYKDEQQPTSEMKPHARVIGCEKGKSLTGGKQKRIKTVDPKDFEGTWKQLLRRRKVFEMRMMNKTVREIVAETGSSSATVITDLKAIDAALRKKIERTQADAILNERLSNLSALRDIALRGVDRSRGNEQIGFLNTAVKLEQQITKLFQDAGVLEADGTPLIVPSLPAPKVTLILQRDVDSEKNLAIARGER